MLDLKERSHKIVFSLIRSQGEVSGADLARQIDMQPSSLVYILRHLKGKGLIELSGYGSSTLKGGKRPVLWRVNPGYGNILGIEVMRNAIRGVLVDLSGEVMLRVEKEFSPGRTEKTISRILKTIHDILNESGTSVSKLLFISIAVPGIVNPITHKIVYSFGLKMEDFDLRSYIQEEFNVPVGVVNDANAGALGEQWFSNDNLLKSNLIYLMYNPIAGGIGLGAVINEKLYTGSNGVAGEVFSRVPGVEQIILSEIEKIDKKSILLNPGEDYKNVQISDLYFYARKNCALSAHVLQMLSHLVAREISKIIGLFDPERIIIGGDLSICEKYICEKISGELTAFMHNYYPFELSVPVIDYARNKVFSPSVGSTALYLSNELHN
ncbi:MAG: ROK family protein [Bacteroidales bacterium]